MEPSEPLGSTGGGARPGYPLRGLSWGLLAAVVAALVLFATVLVVQNGGDSGSGTPAAAPPIAEPASAGTTAPATPSGPAPKALPGTALSRGALAPGWATDGWSWDSTVRPAAAAPDGTSAVSVTYLQPYGGFALRSGSTTSPPATATLRVRVRTDGKPVRLGLQVQSGDDGELGPIVTVDVPAGDWTTLSTPLSALRPPAGVRRISVIAQNVAAGTTVWISDVSLR